MTAAVATCAKSTLNVDAVLAVSLLMQAIRCPCGAVHSPDAIHPVGRQYGLDGEYMDLGNCPTCGSTICVGQKQRRGSKRPRVSPS